MLAGSIVTKVDRVMDVSFTVRWSDRKQLVSQSMSWLRCLSTSSWHPRIGHVTGSLGLLAGNSCILNNRRKMIIINVRNAMVMPITTILFEVGYCVHTQRHITLSLELKSVLNLNLSLSHSPSLSLCMTHAHTHTHTQSTSPLSNISPSPSMHSRILFIANMRRCVLERKKERDVV